MGFDNNSRSFTIRLDVTKFVIQNPLVHERSYGFFREHFEIKSSVIGILSSSLTSCGNEPLRKFVRATLLNGKTFSTSSTP